MPCCSRLYHLLILTLACRCWNVVLVVNAWQQQLPRTSTPNRPLGVSSTTSLWVAKKETTSLSLQQQQQQQRLNPLVTAVQPSATVEIFSRVKQMQAEGTTVTSLCVGEPDFLPPAAVLSAIQQAVQQGETRYTAVTGTAALRAAIAADLYRRKDGLSYNATTEIVVANGAKQCVYQGILATAGTGDVVIIPAPYWPSYPEMARLCQATPVIVETRAESGYLLQPDDLRAALDQYGDKVKLLILCNPSNPTGGVYSQQELQALADVLRDYPSVTVLADEIYERLVYTDSGSVTAFASIEGMWERTMTVNGFSKAYAMTGLRLGYLAAPEPLARAVTVLQSQFTSCAGSLSQAAGVAALTKVDDAELEKNVEIMRQKRDYVLQALDRMPGVYVAVPPSGAFYVLPDVSAYYHGDDVTLCKDLLEQERLALVPGSSFGAPGTVRISYATSMEELELAMEKLSRFLQSNA